MNMDSELSILDNRFTSYGLYAVTILLMVNPFGKWLPGLSELQAQGNMPALANTPLSIEIQKQTIGLAPYLSLSKMQSIPSINHPVTGVKNAVVILVDFPDYQWDTQNDLNFVNPINEPGFEGIFQLDYFQNMLFSLNTFRDPFGQSVLSGSMRDYYRENSYNQFDIDGVVTSWFTVNNSYQTYCNTDGIPNTEDDYGFSGAANVRTFVEEAIALADPEIDFSQFDGDGDGFVDAVFIVHAGPGAEELFTSNYPEHFDYFWSHQSSINFLTMDGVRIGRYTIEPQNGTIGIFCHEYGHVLGLPDLYDTDGSSEGIGEWGLMAGGGWCHLPGDRFGTSPSHFSAWSKIALGWIQPIDISTGNGDWFLPPIESEPTAIRVWNEVMSQPGSDPIEYFLLENRQNVLFDAGLTRRQVDFDQARANGLVIYHVDEAVGSNNNEFRKRIDIEEASPVFSLGSWIQNLDHSRDLSKYEDLSSGNRGDNGDPFPGYFDVNQSRTDFSGDRSKNVFDDQSIPNSKNNQGISTFIAVSNVALDGTDVHFSLETNQMVTSTERTGSPASGPYDLVMSVFPNPINDTAVIQLSSNAGPEKGNANIVIYNLLGQVVRNLDIRPGAAISYWNGKDNFGVPVRSGVYFVVLTTNLEQKSRKIVVAR